MIVTDEQNVVSPNFRVEIADRASGPAVSVRVAGDAPPEVRAQAVALYNAVRADLGLQTFENGGGDG